MRKSKVLWFVAYSLVATTLTFSGCAKKAEPEPISYRPKAEEAFNPNRFKTPGESQKWFNEAKKRAEERSK